MADVNSKTSAETAAEKTGKAATEAAETYTQKTGKAATQAAARAAETYQETAREMIDKFDMAVPEAFRSAAETVVTQSRAAYERSRDAMEGAVEMLEQSFDRAGQGSAAINRKVIDIMQTNMNSGFEFARDVAGARNVAEVLECQATFARKQFETFASQAQEIGELSSKVANDSVESFRIQMSRSTESLKAS